MTLLCVGAPYRTEAEALAAWAADEEFLALGGAGLFLVTRTTLPPGQHEIVLSVDQRLVVRS